jgi:hypothetical protein
MSRPEDDREGLSPSPSNVLNYLDDDEDDEDDENDLYEPAEEETDMTASTAEDDEEVEFTGPQRLHKNTLWILISSRCTRTA